MRRYRFFRISKSTRSSQSAPKPRILNGAAAKINSLPPLRERKRNSLLHWRKRKFLLMLFPLSIKMRQQASLSQSLFHTLLTCPTVQALSLNTQSDSDRNHGSLVQAQALGKENISSSKQVPRGLGPLSPAEQAALLAEPSAGPLQTSRPLIPVAKGSFAEALGIVTSL
jgi:hypothetical protein